MLNRISSLPVQFEYSIQNTSKNGGKMKERKREKGGENEKESLAVATGGPLRPLEGHGRF